REAASVAGERENGEFVRRALRQRHVREAGLAPQAEQRERAGLQALGCLQPALRIDGGVGPGHQLSSLATYWNHATSAGGSQMPAASTRAKCAPTGMNEAREGSLRPCGSPKARPLRRRSSAPSATSRLRPRITASTGARANVDVTIRNSVMKMPS